MKRVLIPILVIAVFGFARTAVTNYNYAGREFQIKIHDVNQVEMCISNFGKFGQTEAQSAGLWWPKGSGQNYIFGAGPWFGTIDQATGDTLVTIGYGPHGAETEFVPGDKDMSSSDPNAIIFMYPVDWPPPTEGWTTAEPPQRNKSHQDSWCVINDLDESHHVPGDTRPIGLVVYQTVYAWNLSSTQDMIFIKYVLRNVSEDTLHDCYFGVCTDNDIGNEAGSAANDRIAGIVLDTFVIDEDTFVVDNLGYQWQEAEETGWTSYPGTIGFDYLQSPYDLKENADKDEDGIPDQYERDSAYYVTTLPDSMWDVDFDGTPDWRDPSEIPQLGMTAFKRFTLNLEPNKDNERYVTLAGYNFKTMVYEPFADTAPASPDDQRFLQCSGPFEIAPDSTATVLVGIILANWKDIFGTPDSALAQIDGTCQFIYDKNWLLPGPPSPPTLTCIPGDAQITLVWDNKSETEPDPYYDIVSDPNSPLYDPFYRQYDFEGYGIWKSLTGKTGDWQLLTRCDLYNGIVFEDTTQPDSIRIKATDNGVLHSYVDTDVRNGFTYYYAVTAFDYNEVKYDTVIDTIPTQIPKPIWFESGLVSVQASPRRDPANYVEPGKPIYEALMGNDSLVNYLDVVYSDPLNVSADKPIYIEFGGPLYTKSLMYVKLSGDSVWETIPVYKIRLLDENEQVVDSASIGITLRDSLVGKPPVSFDYYLKNGFSPLNNISPIVSIPRNHMSLTEDFSIYGGAEVVSGSYPKSLLVPMKMSYSANIGLWAFRGNEYEITWQSPTGPVTVVDRSVGDTIPFKHFMNNDTTTRDSAECWCFLGGSPQNPRNVADTVVTTGPSAFRTKYIYINGGYLALAGGGPMSDTLLPSAGDQWIVKTNDTYVPAPVYAKIKITPVPGQFLSDTTIGLNVKVVPNPYIVHNEWQQSSMQRKLKFINLPANCTIRIFNLNGELVKTIKHTASSGTGVGNDLGGDEWWDLLSENRQLVASGVYIFHIQSDVGEQVGKFVIIQ